MHLGTHAQDKLLKFKPSIKPRKKGDFSEFERDRIVGGRQAGLCVSETAGLWGFSHIVSSRFYKEGSKKEKNIQ